MCGTTKQIATANKNTWQAGNYIATDAIVNGLDNTDNNFWLTGVQLELGSVATPFEFRPYGQELALCQRYYQGIYTGTSSTEAVGYGIAHATTSVYVNIPLQTTMRVTPTLTATYTDWQLDNTVDANIEPTAIALDDLSLSTAKLVVAKVTATVEALHPYFLVGDATSNRVLQLSAEL